MGLNYFMKNKKTGVNIKYLLRQNKFFKVKAALI